LPGYNQEIAPSPNEYCTLILLIWQRCVIGIHVPGTKKFPAFASLEFLSDSS
jgi:hypothetical protein